MNLRRVLSKALALSLVLAATATTSSCQQNGAEIRMEIPEGRILYIARIGLAVVDPAIPTRPQERLEATNHGVIFGEEGELGASLTFGKEVFPDTVDRRDFDSVQPVSYEESPNFEVLVGDIFQYDGYTFQLSTVNRQGDRGSYAGFIILELPQDVTVFPSGDPGKW